MTPTFYICGAPRSGTTSLHRYLCSHPEVVMTTPKETFFFQRHDDLHEIEKAFSTEYLKHYDGEQAVGEGTTQTMYRKDALAKVGNLSNRPKMICLLRNPIERAWSHYLYRVQHRQRKASKSFSHVIRNESKDDNKALSVGIVELGRYSKYVKRISSLFGKENTHVIIHADLFSQPEERLRTVFDFIRADPSKHFDVTGVHNASKYPAPPRLYRFLYSKWEFVKSQLNAPTLNVLKTLVSHVRHLLSYFAPSKKPEMKPADREYLREVYEEPTRELEEWIGQDLSHWE